MAVTQTYISTIQIDQDNLLDCHDNAESALDFGLAFPPSVVLVRPLAENTCPSQAADVRQSRAMRRNLIKVSSWWSIFTLQNVHSRQRCWTNLRNLPMKRAATHSPDFSTVRGVVWQITDSEEVTLFPRYCTQVERSWREICVDTMSNTALGHHSSSLCGVRQLLASHGVASQPLNAHTAFLLLFMYANSIHSFPTTSWLFVS